MFEVQGSKLKATAWIREAFRRKRVNG